MNYARISDQPFVTSKDLTDRKPLSKEAKARREYFKTHKISFGVNPLTQRPEAIITKE